jgi:hypothetical protein
MELVYSEAHLTNDGPQCPLSQFIVVRNHYSAVRMDRLSQHNMAPSLVILLIAEFG